MISTGHPPQPSRLGDLPTSDVKSKAGQHLLPPSTWYLPKRTSPSNHSVRSDSSDISPGDVPWSPDAEPPMLPLTPATSCPPDSSDEAFFHITDREKVVDPEDRDEVDLMTAQGECPDDTHQARRPPPRNGNEGIGSDLRINSDDHLRAKSESGKLDARDQLVTEDLKDHKGLSRRQRLSLLFKGLKKRARNKIGRVFKRIRTKISR